MKASLNLIKRYTSVDVTTDELVVKINQQLGQVEEVVELTPKYKDVVIARVMSCIQHPNADRLHVCMVDDGSVVTDVPRDENGYVQVVCGAPNVREGLFVAWLPPKSTVPASFNEAEPFVLDARELRGVLSQGMIAAADELALGSNHEGIVELSDADLPPFGDIKTLTPGQSFAEVFGLHDTIIDIENKMFTHRPDLFGQLGIAREIAGIQGQQFMSPQWYVNPEPFRAAEGLSLNVFNEAGEKVPRFMALAIRDVTVKPSPFWLQCELVRLGSKPINNIVDATNYVMLLTAQPTHAYDYDTLRGNTLGVRMAKQGETTTLLNSKSYELTEEDIVIVDGEGIVGLGGVMGGGNSEVSPETKNIVLEVATFDMYTVRKTSMRHGLFTDAVTRFTKGQSPLQNGAVMNLLLSSILNTAGGEQASNVFDKETAIDSSEPIVITAGFINERLGLSLSESDIKQMLENVGMRVGEEDGVSHPDPNPKDYPVLIVVPPFWRTDIELPEDIVEEVGRLYGFDKLRLELPQRSIVPAPVNIAINTKNRVRAQLAAAGANEVLSYSFVHENTLKKAGQDAAQAFRLSNALSPDLQYYRLSVLPSLLEKVHPNIKAGHDEFALFEFGKAHRKGDIDDEGLPREYNRLGFVYAAKKSKKNAFYTARRYVDMLLPNMTYVPLDSFTSEHEIFTQLSSPFDPKRSAVVMNGEKFVGVVGELRSSVRTHFKLPSAVAGFELFLSALTGQTPRPYQPLSRFPSISQDISLKVASTVPHERVFNVARDTFQSIQPPQTSAHLKTIGVYVPDSNDSKTITIRLTVASYETTLTDKAVSVLMDGIASVASRELRAERI